MHPMGVYAARLWETMKKGCKCRSSMIMMAKGLEILQKKPEELTEFSKTFFI